MSRQIKVSNTTHEKLNILKNVNRTGSFDGTIQMLMQGCVSELDVISRDQTAFEITYEGYGNIDEDKKTYQIFSENTREISFNELRKAEIGTTYEPELSNHMYYSYDIAQVVYTEKDFVVIKVTTFIELPWIYEEQHIRLLGVNLL